MPTEVYAASSAPNVGEAPAAVDPLKMRGNRSLREPMASEMQEVTMVAAYAFTLAPLGMAPIIVLLFLHDVLPLLNLVIE